MIDIFVIVVCIAAFRVSIESPDVAFLPEGLYSVDLLVVPMWGLYSNMTAQLVSQISSHFIIHYHRRIVNDAVESLKQQQQQEEHDNENSNKNNNNDDDEESSTKYLLRTHAFSRPHRDSSAKLLLIRNWVSHAIIIVAISLAILVTVGCLLPSFSLEILGLIGIAVESGQEFQPATTNHSVFSIVTMLFEEAKFLDTVGDYIGISILSCLFLCTVMIIPILQSICLIYQWFVPLATKQRTRMSIVNEILQAWQYIEVYLIALFVASW